MRRIPSWVKGGCLGAALVVGSIVAFYLLSFLFVWTTSMKDMADSRQRAKVSFVQSELRALGEAIRAFGRANGQFPATDAGLSIIDGKSMGIGDLKKLDPYSPDGKAFYGYAFMGQNPVVFSRGPDKVFDLDEKSDVSGFPSSVIQKTYDATNGAISAGDVVEFVNPAIGVSPRDTRK